jgi:hypothetical protein
MAKVRLIQVMHRARNQDIRHADGSAARQTKSLSPRLIAGVRIVLAG